MRKVTLNLGALRVESFDTTPEAALTRGTVHGRDAMMAATYPDCPSPLCVDTPLASCDGSCAPQTCNQSCNGTCADSCNGTCDSCYTCQSCKASCNGTCYLCIPPDPQPY